MNKIRSFSLLILAATLAFAIACSEGPKPTTPSSGGGSAAHNDAKLKADGGWCPQCNKGWMPGGMETTCKACAEGHKPCAAHADGKVAYVCGCGNEKIVAASDPVPSC